jgi:putative transposase
MESHTQKYKTIKHFHDPGDVHELTFSCYQRFPILVEDADCHHLAEAIDRALAQHALNLSAFVLMPEHAHLLIWPADSEKANVSGFLKSLKMSSSSRIKARLQAEQSDWLAKLTVEERPGKWCFRYWQEGPGYDRNLKTPRAIEASIDYIHANPVKRGLCARAEDWPWSSYRHYLLDPQKPPPEKPKFTPLPADFVERV